MLSLPSLKSCTLNGGRFVTRRFASVYGGGATFVDTGDASAASSDKPDILSKSTKSKGTKETAQKIIPVALMTEDMARIELLELNDLLNLHDSLYYSSTEDEANESSHENSVSAISDRAYDKHVQRADSLTGKFYNLRGLVDKFNRVGYTRSNKFEPFRHSDQPLLSLDNAFSEDQLHSFVSRCATKLGTNKVQSETAGNDDPIRDFSIPADIIVEPKIDGLSLALHYVDGVLVGAGTRGDGVVGENVTNNVKHISGVPITLPEKVSIEVRGEVYITKSDFAELNRVRASMNVSQFSTARNAAAGGLRQIDPALTAGRNLRFFAYSLFDIDNRAASAEENIPISAFARADQWKTLDMLQGYGFEVASPIKLCSTFKEVVDHCSFLESTRMDLDFDVDGAVLKVDSLDKQKRIGQLARYPSWATAYKFKAEEAVTVLKEIIVQVGRTGVLTPVAVLEPVVIGGVVIERATLHNEAEVRRHNLVPGAKVVVIRAGDVIPKVKGRSYDGSIDLDDAASEFTLPLECPVCRSPTEKDGDILVRCTGTAVCSAQVTSQISHFCSRDAADIDGLGPARVEELHRMGMVKNISDIYRLRHADLLCGSGDTGSYIDDNIDGADEKQSLRQLKGWGDRSVNNLLAAIDTRRELSFERFLYGLGIRHIGQGSAKDIAQAFGEFEVFWHYVKNAAECRATGSEEEPASCERLFAISGVGPKLVDSLLDFASLPSACAVIDDTLSEIKILPVQSSSKKSFESSGEVFLFTGKLEAISRSDATRACVAMGGTVASTFTNEVTILVSGTDKRKSSKLIKAEESGNVKVIDEDEFLRIIKLRE
jgi:DNA ligase (NAD+)